MSPTVFRSVKPFKNYDYTGTHAHTYTHTTYRHIDVIMKVVGKGSKDLKP